MYRAAPGVSIARNGALSSGGLREGLPREQFPVRALLLPDLQDADLRDVRLAAALALAQPGVAHDGVGASDRHGLIAEHERLVDRLLRCNDIEERRLVLDD